MKQKKQYIVRKYVMAYSAQEAIKNEHKFPADDVFLDEEWKRINLKPEPKEIGFKK